MYTENKALEETKVFNLCCYVVNVINVVNVYAFCLRTNKDSSMGEFNKSIISSL